MKPTAEDLYRLHTSGGGDMTYDQIAERHDLTYNGVRDKIRRFTGAKGKKPIQAAPTFRGVQASSFPQMVEPLRTEGDALILCDLEAPYHHADFLNRCLDLAQAWNIRQCIIGGDCLHFDQFSHWEANWREEKKPGDNLTPETAQVLRDKIAGLPERERAEIGKILDTIPVERTDNDELAEARRVLETIGGLFDRVDFVIGNHDSRFLKLLNSPLLPRKLLDFIGGCPEPKWRIAGYYYSILVSGGETFRIEHPKSAAASTAIKLADKYECSVICGHSHLHNFGYSTSGKHYAVQAGCIVDETRLAYAAQRSTNSPAHGLGAVIVVDGYPFILEPRSPWQRLKRL